MQGPIRSLLSSKGIQRVIALQIHGVAGGYEINLPKTCSDDVCVCVMYRFVCVCALFISKMHVKKHGVGYIN